MTADKTINAIEVDIDPELEKRIAERYDLPKMLGDSEDREPDPLINLSQPIPDEPSELQEITKYPKPLDEIYKIKLHPLLNEEIPDALKKRYLINDNVYYSKSKDKGLIFEDKGKVIQSKSSDPDDIEAMIRLSQSKNWSHIKVSGSADFKREVWLVASIQGMEVEGYTPNPQDIALVNDAINRSRNKIEFAEPSVAVDIPQATQAQKQLQDPSDDQHTPAKNIMEDESVELLDHGKAKYLNDPNNTQSYYVKTRDASGAEKTIWGVDLERAIYESKANINDKVLIANQGNQLVTITVPVRNEAGVVIGSAQEEAIRNTWNVDKVTPAEIAIVATAKAKGAGPVVQAAMKKKLKIAVNQLENMGVTIPVPKILDPHAPLVSNTNIEHRNISAQKNIREPKKSLKR